MAETAPGWKDSYGFWETFIRQNPGIAAITGSWYPAVAHGVRAKNESSLFERDVALQAFTDGECPRLYLLEKSFEGKFLQQTKGLFAIGCLMEPLVAMENVNLKRRWVGVPLVDFECKVHDKNLRKIKDVLKKKRFDWTVFVSNGSYHLVIEALIPPRNIIWWYGQLIKDFAQVWNPNFSHVFEAWGNEMQLGWRDDRRIERVAYEVLDTVAHVDDPVGTGLVYILDLRHMLHTALDILDALNGRPSRLGCLRVPVKPGYDRPPIEVAKGRRGKVWTLAYSGVVSGEEERGQIRLPIEWAED